MHLLVLEDLGHLSDATTLYGTADASDTLPLFTQPLVSWLARLHRHSSGAAARARSQHANRALRALNHAHIFEIPFQNPPAIDLDAVTPGLSDLATEVCANRRVPPACAALGERYLRDGGCLLHGDFFPGSWLLSEREARVIDPEFSFYGDPEFDLGVCVAHMRFIGYTGETALGIVADYDAGDIPLSTERIQQYAAVEILRRLLGVAQLPIDNTLGTEASLDSGSVRCVVAVS